MKKLYLFIAFIISLNAFSQDVLMQNGTFNRCAPDKIFDSGGGSSNYGSNENIVTTICAINPGDFIILDFTAFNTQLDQDILKIYNGPDTSSPLIGTYSGSPANSPGRISATSINTSGCLTLQFISDSGGTGSGFAADILCAEPCQTITPSIDSTTPIANGNVVTIFPGQSVDFNGSATFSGNGTGATYSWNFGDGSPNVAGQSVSHTFNNSGTYNVAFKVTDTNPQGCSMTTNISVLVLQDIITVNNSAYVESSYTPQQLIEDVLVSGGCSAVSDFVVKENGNTTQTKSFGFFTNGGALNFPFEEGIVMSTGAAIGGGNSRTGMLVSTDYNASGDGDLEAALGITGTHDASYVKFNFVPTTNSISFRYLIASEEYDGNFECGYSDGFAFLLREVGTTTYTNLAVLPDGTPVSVTNINNSGSINSNSPCTSHPEYFAGYNIPGPNGIRDTNYNGRTVALTAVANVTLGVTYEIKLVVADQSDWIYDSAIFLEAGSFILGGELGNDITIAGGTAQCDGDSVVLDTQAPNATHTWYKDGVLITGETGPIITVTETASYSVDVFFAAGCETSDSVFVEFYPDIEIGSVDNLFLCNPGAAPYEFDLTGNNPLILGAITDPENYLITFHESQSDADSGMNAIAVPDVYSGTDGQMIFARLKYNNSDCFDTEPFTLNIIDQPTINTVADLELCDDFSNNGIEQFDLDSQSALILGTQPSANFIVNYYTSFADADSNSNALVSPFTNTMNPQPIYVRVENTGTANCTSVSINPVFNLVVNDRALANPPNDLFICDDASNDEIGQFNLLQQTLTILGSQSSTDYSVIYYESQVDAETANNPISNPASFTNTSNPQPIFVRVFENVTPECYGITDFLLNVNPLPSVTVPSPLVVCDDNVPDGITQMDLTVKDNEISGGVAGTVVSYHLTQSDADSGNSPLTVPYTNTLNGQTIYVRVQNTTTGCHGTTTLVLQVAQAPVAFVPDPLSYCDPNNDGFGQFILSEAEAQITGGASGLTVSYHETFANAQNNANPLPDAYQNIVEDTQIIHVRVVNAALTTDCATIVQLVLNVLPTPVVPLDISDYVICDTNADGTVQFDLTSKTSEILGAQAPADYVLTFHLTPEGAESGTGQIVNVGNYTNAETPEQTIYIRLEGVNGCHKTGQLTIRVDLPPVVVVPAELALCDDAVADGRTGFDLTLKDGEITGNDGSLSVRYYTTDADARADTGAINPATSYTNTSVNGLPANPQTLFARVTDTDTGCTAFTTLTIRVLPNPEPRTDPSGLVLCDDTNTGDGREVFDLTANENYIIDGELGVSATYHTTPEDAEAGSNAIADPTAYTNTNTDNTPRTIHVRVTNDLTGCYAIVDFDILVNPLPGVVAVTDYIICEVETDGRAQFDLVSKNVEVLNGQDPTRYMVSYHATQTGADNLTGALLSPYVNTSNPQRIHVAVTDNVTGCSISTPSFDIQVDNGAEANSDMAPITQVICDNIGGNDGLGQFDLAANDAEVLDGQDAQDFIVTYYVSLADAELGTDPIPYTYENTSSPQTIYVRVDNDTPDGAGMDSSICYAVAELTLKVDLLPIFDLEDTYTLCIDTNGTEVIGAPILDTGLSAAAYTFVWSLDGTVLPGETGPSLTASQSGTHGVEVANIATGCTNTDSSIVEISSPPMISVEVITEAFADPHTIVAVATGDGDYEYSLDGGPWQSSGTFADVTFGEHTVMARDTKGCGLASGTVMVLDYPHFFTPNGDGRNETWNIVGFAGQASAKIYIFDRFGKLLKQISPSGLGWNGTYNGNPMPSSDYWFTVEYGEPSTGQQKQFKAHFTLKR